MDTVIGAIIVLVVIVLSIAQKMKEQREARRRMDLDDYTPTATPDLEPKVRPARLRGAQPKKQADVPIDMEDMIRQLMGQPPKPAAPVERAEEVEEGDWQPVQPPIRSEMPRRPVVQPPRPAAQQPQRQPAAQRKPALQPQPIRPQRQRPARTPSEMMSTREARPRRPEPAPDEIERRKRVELERRQAQQAEEQRRTRQISPRPMRRVAPTARRRLFSNLDDVRRAIIVAEVINPPRALRDLEERV